MSERGPHPPRASAFARALKIMLTHAQIHEYRAQNKISRFEFPPSPPYLWHGPFRRPCITACAPKSCIYKTSHPSASPDPNTWSAYSRPHSPHVFSSSKTEFFSFFFWIALNLRSTRSCERNYFRRNFWWGVRQEFPSVVYELKSSVP